MENTSNSRWKNQLSIFSNVKFKNLPLLCSQQVSFCHPLTLEHSGITFLSTNNLRWTDALSASSWGRKTWPGPIRDESISFCPIRTAKLLVTTSLLQASHTEHKMAQVNLPGGKLLIPKVMSLLKAGWTKRCFLLCIKRAAISDPVKEKALRPDAVTHTEHLGYPGGLPRPRRTGRLSTQKPKTFRQEAYSSLHAGHVQIVSVQQAFMEWKTLPLGWEAGTVVHCDSRAQGRLPGRWNL